MPTYEYTVSGVVQGVGFRYFARKRAQALGIRGYVRNLPDGSVQVVAEADDALLLSFEAILKQGPPMSQVTEVTKVPAAGTGLAGFEIWL